MPNAYYLTTIFKKRENKMSTQEQINANRTNAQFSSGPKTAEGKATSSQNAVTHGIFAKNDVISGEDLARYELHRQDIYDEFVPLTPTEAVLTQRIASLTWRLMRADRLQTTVINTLVDAQHKANQPAPIRKFNIAGMIKSLRLKDADPDYPLTDNEIILAGLVRYDNVPVTTDPAVDEAMHAASLPPGKPYICEAEIELGTVIYHDFDGSAVIERLQGYEQKIETSLFKTIRQIQQYQDTRIKQDIARNKIQWAQLCIENEERKIRREEEYQQNMRNKPSHRTAGVSPASSAPNAKNEPNSDLTSITETTYNKNHCNKAKTSDTPEPPSPPQHQ
jgi:hypothetical protein